MSKQYRLVAFTGAGISRDSGIPTFEELDNRDMLTREFCQEHPAEFYDNLLSMERVCRKAEPNAAHIALHQYGIPVITMNIDALHLRAGSRDTIEIHGSLEKVHCRHCSKDLPFSQIEQSIYCGCGRVYEHDVVLYGDMMPRLNESLALAADTEELLIVGTSFYTSTSTYVANAAKRAGAKITLINADAMHKVPEYLESIFGRKEA